MENTYLTGASGFIGKNLISFSEKRDIHFVCGNRSNPFNFYNCKSVVHLAGRAHRMEEMATDYIQEYRQINRDLTLKLARNSVKMGLKKFIFISSVKVMGEGWKKQKERLITKTRKDLKRSKVFIESDECRPDDPYSISKWEAEQGLVEVFSGQSNIQCIILRLPMVYGPGNKGNMLPLLKCASKGIPLPIGSAKGKRSMIYVKNLCDAILKILQDNRSKRPPLQTYFINDDYDLTSCELYSMMSQAYKGKNGIFYMPEFLLRLAGIIGSGIEKSFKKKIPLNEKVVSRLFDEFRFSSKAFCRDYNWSPPYNPKQGIQETVDWFKDENRNKN